MVGTVSVVTRKGQITIPVEVRRALGISEGDKVSIELADDEVRIRRVGSIVEQTAGAFKSQKPTESAERLREIAEEIIADDAKRRGGQ